MFWNLFAIAIGGLLVAWSLYLAISSLWRARGHRKLVGFVGGILVAYGISAFYGLAFSARGSLPASFEWPVGRADQLIEVPDGRRIAVHPASARIQVYDRDWKLLHAWVVPAGAGDFRAILLPDDQLVVWTVHGAQRYTFILDGTQVRADFISARAVPASACYGRSRLRSNTHSAMALFFVIGCMEHSNSRWAFACLCGSEAVL